MVTSSFIAIREATTSESISSELEGDIDFRGFMGLSDVVPRGFKTIRVRMKVKSDAPAEKLAELSRYSPVYNTLVNPTPVEIIIEKAWPVLD